MSVYSRWVEARGTTSIESTPAARQASKPVLRSRIGSGACVGEAGCGVQRGRAVQEVRLDREAVLRLDRERGHRAPRPRRERPTAPGPVSLSSATTASTRESVPWTFDTAAAPSEWPTIATRVVRPGVTVRLSALRSNSCQYGL